MDKKHRKREEKPVVLTAVNEDKYSPYEISQLQAKVDGLHDRMERIANEERVIRVVERVTERVHEVEAPRKKTEKKVKPPKDNLIRV